MKFINKLIMYIFTLLYNLLKYFLGEKMQSGELVVIGADRITISLDGVPSKFSAHFKGEQLVVPCNPQHCDTLDVKVERIGRLQEYQLVFTWSVSSVRVIKWSVYY